MRQGCRRSDDVWRSATASCTTSRSTRARAHRGGRVGRLHARVPCCVRARRASRRHRAWLSVLPQHPDRARHGAGADRRRSRDPMGAYARAARGGWAPRRARRRLPVEPDRDGARRERARTARAPLRRARHASRRRRDLPRHHVRRTGTDAARRDRSGDRRQQLLEVLLDDGLAGRLGGDARRSRRVDRAAAAEPLHLRPPRVADRRPRSARRDRPSSTVTSRVTGSTATC